MPKNDTPGTVPQAAPVTGSEEKPVPVYTAPAPISKKIERQGVRGAPLVHRYPEVRGGICEWCGVIDNNLPSTEQYKLCPHYKHFGQLRCSYCDESKDPTDVVGHAVLNIYDHPTRPDEVVVVCNSYECTRKHQERFETTR
jgi:hypothetical protein